MNYKCPYCNHPMTDIKWSQLLQCIDSSCKGKCSIWIDYAKSKDDPQFVIRRSDFVIESWRLKKKTIITENFTLISREDKFMTLQEMKEKIEMLEFYS